MVKARRALLGLGSNLGDRLATLRAAVSGLAETAGVALTGCSSVHASPPMGPVEQGEFLNAAVAVETELAPRALLAACLAVETALGRERRVRWGPRTLDIDILWMEGVCLAEPGLSIPHPGLAERAFVLRPLAELAPELRLPDGRTAAAAVEELADDACVRIPGARLRG